MLRLTSLIYSIAATALAGTAVIGVLTAGHDTAQAISIAAGAGALAALPVSWLTARQLMQPNRSSV